MTTHDSASLVEVMTVGQSMLSQWLASLIGRRQLRKMQRSGLPHCLYSPFLFLLNLRLGSEEYQVVRRIEALRSEMAKRTDEFVGVFSEAESLSATGVNSSSANSPQSLTRVRSLTQVVQVSSVLPQWGAFLYLCANAIGAKTILELGAGAGISGCYLASGKNSHRFITVEGSPERARLAKAHLYQVANNFELVNASFDEALDRILPTLRDGIDMVYIDGGKDKPSNLHYLERLTPSLNKGGLVVFDDIHWSSEMWKMWEVVRGRKGFSYTINAGRFGVCVWTGGTTRPKMYTLFGIAGLDLYMVKQLLESMTRRGSSG
jgi:predicted O-methyltransferase YrrM